MSLILKGIDLPNSGQIEIIIRPHGKVWIETKGIGRAEAFQIPTPHGRLIDEKQLKEALTNPITDETSSITWGDIDNAQTILEAEE